MLGTESGRRFVPGMPSGFIVAWHPDRTVPYTIWLRGKVVRFEATEEGAVAWVKAHSREWAEAEYD